MDDICIIKLKKLGTNVWAIGTIFTRKVGNLFGGDQIGWEKSSPSSIRTYFKKEELAYLPVFLGPTKGCAHGVWPPYGEVGF